MTRTTSCEWARHLNTWLFSRQHSAGAVVLVGPLFGLARVLGMSPKGSGLGRWETWKTKTFRFFRSSRSHQAQAIWWSAGRRVFLLDIPIHSNDVRSGRVVRPSDCSYTTSVHIKPYPADSDDSVELVNEIKVLVPERRVRGGGRLHQPQSRRSPPKDIDLKAAKGAN